MRRDQLAFLFGGLAFGLLFGFGLFKAMDNSPQLTSMAAPATTEAPGPRGTMAPTQSGGAPMIAEINEMKRRLQGDPDDVAAIARLANIYHDAGMWEQAAGYYERALTLAPDNADLLTDLGVCYRGMQEFDRALEVFDRANGVDPSHWQSLHNKVVVAASDLERFDLAMSALEAMEALTPRPAELEGGRLEQMRQALEHAASR